MPTLLPVDFAMGESADEDRYQIMGRLHQGQITEVYRAMDWHGEGEVALKVFHEPNDAVSHQVDLEIGSHMGLAGRPGIVAVRGIGIIEREMEIESRFYRYLATKFAEDGTYHDFTREHPRDLDAALKMAASIIPALEEVHSRGWVHRDIKPSNILSAGESGQWELGDFGLAEQAFQKPDTASLAAAAKLGAVALDEADTMAYSHSDKDVLGTVGYMAPESLKDVALTPRVDIFPLGITLFHGATGRLPYECEDLKEYAAAVTTESPVAARTLNRAVPAKLDQLIRECLRQDPMDRPTAEEVDKSLREMA